MPIIEENCEYHPQREALKKCEKCDKLICFDCVKHLKIDPWNTRDPVGKKLDVCPICYYDFYINRSQANNICSFFLVIGFISIPAYFFRNAPSSMMPFLTLWFSIPCMILFYGLYLTFVKVPRDRKSATIMKKQFLESLQNKDDNENDDSEEENTEDDEDSPNEMDEGSNEISLDDNTIDSENEDKTKSQLRPCPFCGKLINLEAYACTFCGKIVSAINNLLYCQKCGAANPINRYTCQQCGRSLDEEKVLHKRKLTNNYE